MVLRDGLRSERLAQGDILDEVEFYAPRNGSYRDTNRFPGMITSHSCDFTKFIAERDKGAPIDRFPLLVAPLITRKPRSTEGLLATLVRAGSPDTST